MKIVKGSGCIVAVACFVALSATAKTPTLSAEDKSAIQGLMASYAQALFGCHAEDFADLFVPETGYFASGFRGHMVGRKRLVELVESEPHCLAPKGTPQATRAGGTNAPTVEIEVASSGVRGVAKVGTAEYQDEYTKTPQGWRFASRTVITAAEKAAGLDARGLLAIDRLGGSKLGDYYAPDKSGVERLQTSGVRIAVSGQDVTGRAFLKGGGYDQEAYEKLGPGKWRVKSSTHVAAESH